MKKIKSYFSNWNAVRGLRVVMAIVLIIAYFNTKEAFFLFFAGFLMIQAIFNISCPGGSCGTSNSQKDKEPIYKFKKYNSKN